MKTRTHVPEVMERVKPYVMNTVYVYKGWKTMFVCPVCGKSSWQHLNFLGRTWVPVCFGNKVIKMKKSEVQG